MLKQWVAKQLELQSKMLLKKVNEEEQTITAVVLEPNPVEDGVTSDLHNDFYSAEEVKKACENFNEHCFQPNIEHELNVTKEVTEILESFILPVPARIGDQEVKKGSWLQVWKIHDPTLWELVKSGAFTGFSIGCTAEVEDVE